MTPSDSQNEGTPRTEIGEQNVDQLLRVAYDPEEPPAEFVRAVEERMLQAARRRQSPAGAARKPSVTPRRWNPWFAWATAAAAIVVAGVIAWHDIQSHRIPPPQVASNAGPALPVPDRGISPLLRADADRVAGLVQPRPRAAAEIKPLAVGETIETKANQRRRVLLPDGSVVYLNGGTSLRVEAARQLALSKGQVYIEVQPKAGETFLVKTPHREVTALGTRFSVREESAGTSVLVTQGKVKVSGLSDLIYAGSQLALSGGGEGEKVTPAPRATAELEWTKDLMAESASPLVPESEYAGGALVAVDPQGQEMKLSLRRYDVDVYIEDGYVRTTIDQTYFNHENWQMEGTFYFPLPPDAALSRLAMYVDGKLMEGGMAERERAREVYESIRYQRRDPALLEWVDGSTFKMRVFPLIGRQEKRIVLSYVQKLPSEYGQAEYRFPAGHTLPVVREWAFHARIKDAADKTSPITWNCASHGLDAKADGRDLVLEAHGQNIQPNRDVVLQVTDPRAAVGELARFRSAYHEGYKYVSLRYRPDLEARPHRERRDWIFLFESGGDRDPLLARAQVEVLRSMLENAEHEDRFAILTAGTRAARLTEGFLAASPENVKSAIELLEKTHLVGALDLEAALTAAVGVAKQGENVHLVHLGAGTPILGERQQDALVNLVPQDVKYVGIGVGKRWNRSFMKAAAARTGGYFTQINPDENVAWRGFALLGILNAPRLINVKVSDEAGKATFLCDSDSLAGGQEVAAVARLDRGQAAPVSVVVTGMLDGHPFSRTVHVDEAGTNADYLPRVWAKMEIDRLIDDGAEKNKARIIELSKSMYVMSPFTSLLVLENEAMYKQFNVDRGRKDHWALYPCPPTIPVVTELLTVTGAPVTTQPVAADGRKKIEEVCNGLIVRLPVRILRWPSDSGYYYNYYQAATAWQVLNAYAVPYDYDGDYELDGIEGSTKWSDWSGITNGRLGMGHGGRGGRPIYLGGGTLSISGAGGSAGKTSEIMKGLSALRPVRTEAAPSPSIPMPSVAARPSIRQPAGGPMSASRLMPPGDFPVDMSRSLELSDRQTRIRTGRESFDPVDGMRGRGMRGPVSAEKFKEALDLSDFGRKGQSVFRDRKNLDESRLDRDRLLRPGEEWGGEGLFHGADYLISDRTYSGEWRQNASVLYERPYFSGDWRVFHDLLAYAPGMNTSWADIQAVCEAEGPKDFVPASGKIDAGAARLIEKARSASWRILVMGNEGGFPKSTLTFDGSGRYVWEGRLTSGLNQRVYCDGATILHVYPELGLGARRTVSRFHREELTDSLPMLLPPADDLAASADLTLLDARTVALTAVGAETAKDKDGNSAAYWQIRLVFAEDGSLAERQAVEMPAGKILARQTYDKDGTIKTLDADGKVLAERQLDIRRAAEPDLKPDVKDLVVLPMPIRTIQQVIARQKSKAMDEQRYEQLSEEAALELIAADLPSNNWQAVQVIGRRFINKGDRRVGFYALLLSTRTNVDPAADVNLGGSVKVRVDPVKDHPTSVLCAYVASQWELQRKGNNYDPPEISKPGAGFIGDLSAFRTLWNRWNSGKVNNSDEAQRKKERQRVLDYVRDSRSPVFAWSLLAQAMNYGGDQEWYRSMAEAYGRFGKVSGLSYYARYEAARALRNSGNWQQAGKQYIELYRDTLKAGALPPIDNDFRSAFQNGDPNHQALWTQLMRETAGTLVEKKDYSSLLMLACQCFQVSDQPLAEEFLANVLAAAPKDRRSGVSVAAFGALWRIGRYDRADLLLQPVLEDPEWAKSPYVWRLAWMAAQRQNKWGRAVRYLEKAMEIEYAALPDIVNLQAVREDYGQLMTAYHQLAQAMSALDAPAPRDLLVRVVKAADRWRMLDPEASGPCQSAARALGAMGEVELAWEYLTTPLGLKPNEAAPWLGMAQTLQQQGDLRLADRAYACAFQTEQTNAQILWDHAQLLQQMGQGEAARGLYRQIAQGHWQPRFEWLQAQAKRYVGP